MIVLQSKFKAGTSSPLLLRPRHGLSQACHVGVAGFPGGNYNGQLQVTGVTTDGDMFHTVRFPDPNQPWALFQSVKIASGKIDPGKIASAGAAFFTFWLLPAPPFCYSIYYRIESIVLRLSLFPNENILTKEIES